MKTIILTGGIATGKTTVLKYLLERDPRLVIFDCDAYVSSLLDSGALAPDLIQLFGPNSVYPNGVANRELIRNHIFQTPNLKENLEKLIHPLVRKECLALQQNTDKTGTSRGFIIDIPLYYETKADYPHDLVVVVSLSSKTQRRRLKERNHFSDETIDSIIKNQLPLEEKEKRADVLIWNEASLDLLTKQVNLFYNHYIHA